MPPSPPIEEALELLRQAMDIAFSYLEDPHYVPTEEELEQFRYMERSLLQHHAAAEALYRRLKERCRHPVTLSRDPVTNN